jgi:hypothetical protein
MALINYAGQGTYLKIEGIDIKNFSPQTVSITLSLYSDSSKSRKIWSSALQMSVRLGFRGNAKCTLVNQLDENYLTDSQTELYLIFNKKIYAKTNDAFIEEVGFTGDIIFSVTDNQWYELKSDGLWDIVSPEVFTEAIYNEYFSVSAFNQANPYKKAYEFLLSKPEFSHCVSDE